MARLGRSRSTASAVGWRLTEVSAFQCSLIVISRHSAVRLIRVLYPYEGCGPLPRRACSGSCVREGQQGYGQAVAQNGRPYGVVANVAVIPDKGFQAMVMSWSSVPAGGESIVGLAAGGYDRARRGHCRPPTHESEGGDRGAGRPSASAGQGLE